MARLRFVIAGLVTAVWLAGYLIAFYGGGPYPAELAALMVPVLGWVFGSEFVAALKRRGDDDETWD